MKENQSFAPMVPAKFKPGNLLKLSDKALKHYGYPTRNTLKFCEPILVLKKTYEDDDLSDCWDVLVVRGDDDARVEMWILPQENWEVIA